MNIGGFDGIDEFTEKLAILLLFRKRFPLTGGYYIDYIHNWLDWIIANMIRFKKISNPYSHIEKHTSYDMVV